MEPNLVRVIFEWRRSKFVQMDLSLPREGAERGKFMNILNNHLLQNC
jgi:hypothetical protein